MFRVVLVQCVASLLVAAIAAAISGGPAALSALCGGAACWVPNGLFALNLAWMARARRRHAPAMEGPGPASASMLPILLGEFCKVLLMAALLLLVVRGYRDVVWPALIVSVSVVLLVQPVALALREA